MKPRTKKYFIPFIAFVFIASPLSAQLYIAPGATLKLSGAVRVSLLDVDLINDGVIAAPANGRIIFTGNDNNFIAGSASTHFAEMEIAKTGNGLITLQQNISVKNKIIFTSNLFELNKHSIDLGTTAYLEGENENSRITGINGGEVFVTTTLNAPSSSNPGNLGAVITSSQNLGVTTIHRGHQSQSVFTGSSSIHRYFVIAPTINTALNATLRIYYFDGEKNALNENIFGMWKSNDDITWSGLGYDARDGSSNFVEKTGLNDFSKWTLSQGGALPVNGLHLAGMWKQNAAQLNWSTLTEYHNSHFIIERKYKNELNFVKIGRKNSAFPDGNSQTETQYYWTDFADIDKGPIAYRLQQLDIDGHIEYSNIIIVKPRPSPVFIIGIYPSLGVGNRVFIKTGNKKPGKTQVNIYDVNGRVLLHKQLRYQSQWLDLPIMSTGIYKISILSGTDHWEGSFMKN